MKRILGSIAGLIMLGSTGVFAVDMQPTPIQSQFFGEIQQQGRALLMAATDDPWIEEESDTQKQQPSQQRTGGRKSVAKAAALSLLVPGLGQTYLGTNTKAKYFFIAEALVWVGYGSFRIYGDWKEDDMIQFGNTNAHAHLDGKSDEYLDWVGFYDDINDFNGAGRVGDPDRQYLPDTPENHWHWDSPADQEAFRSLKNSSREADRRAEFMLWTAAMNRVVSVIFAVLDARKINASEGDKWELGGIKYDIDVNPLSSTRQISLTVYPGF